MFGWLVGSGCRSVEFTLARFKIFHPILGLHCICVRFADDSNRSFDYLAIKNADDDKKGQTTNPCFTRLLCHFVCCYDLSTLTIRPPS